MWDDMGDKGPPKMRMIWQLQVVQVWNFDFAGLGKHSESHALRHSWRRDFSEQLFGQVVQGKKRGDDPRVELVHRLLGKSHHDLTSRPKPIDDGESKGNHPLLWPNYSG